MRNNMTGSPRADVSIVIEHLETVHRLAVSDIHSTPGGLSLREVSWARTDLLNGCNERSACFLTTGTYADVFLFLCIDNSDRKYARDKL